MPPCPIHQFLTSTGRKPSSVMKVLIFFTLAAVAYAKPSGILTPAVTFPVASQYHAQDALGQYSYGYSSGLSSKAEARALNGVTQGGYSYVDAEGKLQTVQYIADDVHGFRVAATNLPVAPGVPTVPALVAPVPVADTPEVADAKTKHLAALKEAEARAAAAPEEVQVQPLQPQAVAYTIQAPVLAQPYAFVSYPGFQFAYQTVVPGVTTYATQVAAVAPAPAAPAVPAAPAAPVVEAKAAAVEEKKAEEAPAANP